MLTVKRIAKTLAVLSIGVMVASCSSTKKSADVENAYGADSQGYGSEGPFINSAYMAKLLGIEKNTIYFAFDSNVVQSMYQSIVQANANYLKSHHSAKVRLEGNTDPRGSREYNIGLGQRRASAVAQQLEMLGVSSEQIVTVSYGQERPVMTGDSEQAYALDRRVDIVYMSK